MTKAFETTRGIITMEATGIDNKFEAAFKEELRDHLKRYIPYIVRDTLLKHDTEYSVFEHEDIIIEIINQMLEDYQF